MRLCPASAIILRFCIQLSSLAFLTTATSAQDHGEEPAPEAPEPAIGKSAAIVSKSFFPTLAPCEIYELTFPFAIAEGMDLRLPASLSLKILEQMSSELGAPTLFSKYFMPRPTTRRYQMAKTLERLVTFMKARDLVEIPFAELKRAAATRFTELKSSGKIGECYVIQTYQKALIASKSAVPVFCVGQA